MFDAKCLLIIITGASICTCGLTVTDLVLVVLTVQFTLTGFWFYHQLKLWSQWWNQLWGQNRSFIGLTSQWWHKEGLTKGHIPHVTSITVSDGHKVTNYTDW